MLPTAASWQFSDRVSDSVTPELLLCTALIRTGVVDGCGVAVLSGSTARFPVAATDEVFERVARDQFSLWQGPGPTAMTTGERVVVDDLRAEQDRWPLLGTRVVAHPVRTWAAFPLYVVDVVVGLLGAYRVTVDPFSGQDLDVLEGAKVLLEASLRKRFAAVQGLRLPPSPLLAAVGMIMAQTQVSPEDAMASLRARALVQDMTIQDLAQQIVDHVNDATGGDDPDPAPDHPDVEDV